MTPLDRARRRALIWGGAALLINGLTLFHLRTGRKVSADAPLDVDTTTTIVLATTAVTVLAVVAALAAHRLPGALLGVMAALSLVAGLVTGWLGLTSLDDRLVTVLLGAAGMINLAAALPAMIGNRPSTQHDR